MGKFEIKYYSVKKGRGFWQPTQRMRELGFQPVSCGPDGPAAWETARQWNERWQAARRGLEPDLRPPFPPGSVGAAFDRYRRLNQWAKKSPATKAEWEVRAWRWIGPVFGDVAPGTIEVEHIEDLRKLVAEKVSEREAHRVIKIWRALWQAMAGFKMVIPDSDPSLAITNTAAKGRYQIWSEGEAVRLVKNAWRMGYGGLAAALACMWDTGFSPVDIRLTTASMLKTDGTGLYIDRSRAKTGRKAIGTLGPRAARLLATYIEGMGIEFHDDAPIIRTPAHEHGPGRPRPPAPYTRDVLAKHFRAVRLATFGELEDRKMMDFRRSAASEMQAGGASAEQMSSKLANSIAKSRELQNTYLPHQVATVRLADVARKRGRDALRRNK
jgi:hypothetical protein